MRFYTHLAFGIIIASLFTKPPWLVIASGFFALIPDIDAAGSFIGKRLPLISGSVQLLLGHRGIIHSLLAAIAAAGIAYVIMPALALPAMVGFCSHLALDMLTPEGVSLFYPLSSKRVRGPIRTGGIIEAAILIILVFLLGHWTLDILGQHI